MSIQTQGFLFYSMGYNLLLSLLANGNPFKLPHVLLTCLQHSLSTSLLSGMTWCSRFILYFLWFRSAISRKELPFIREWYLGSSMLSRYHWFQAISVNRNKDHHMQIYMHTYYKLYIYEWVYECVCGRWGDIWSAHLMHHEWVVSEGRAKGNQDRTHSM